MFSDTSEIVLAETPYWEETFWFCFSLCIIFLVIGPYAIKLAKAGRLGMDKHNHKAKFPQAAFFLGKILNILGKSAYMTIMKAMLDVYSCEFDESTGDWYVMRNKDINCFSNDHSLYLVMALVGILIYYPTSTILLPNLQY